MDTFIAQLLKNNKKIDLIHYTNTTILKIDDFKQAKIDIASGIIR